jgi:parallel beta-helix repeat protein
MKRLIVLTGLIILLLTACQAVPTPTQLHSTQTPITSTATLVVPTSQPINPNEDLAAKITAAADGDTLYLEAGAYHLSQSINIKKSLTIIGAGQDKTKIFSDAKTNVEIKIPYVLQIDTAGTAILQGLAISEDSERNSRIIQVLNGNLKMSDCQVGNPSRSKSKVFYGIYANNDSTIHINNSLFSTNTIGIILDKSANAEINNSRFESNEVAIYTNKKSTAKLALNASKISVSTVGVMLAGSAQVALTQNTFEKYNVIGINILDQVSGTISENQLSEGKSGIEINSPAALIIEKNQINNATQYGIKVNDMAVPTIKDNILQFKTKDNIPDSASSGIAYWGKSGGQALDNTIHGFGWGFEVHEESRPVMDSNTLFNNGIDIIISDNSNAIARHNQIVESQPASDKRTGIMLGGQAKGDVSSNTISGLSTGILVTGSSQVTLTENILKDNVAEGIRFWDHGSGAAVHNQLTNCGIVAAHSSNATLTDNLIQVEAGKDKPAAGIIFSSPGQASNNTISGFQTGIEVKINLKEDNPDATILLEGNTITDNENGIVYASNIVGAVHNNKISNNQYAIQLDGPTAPALQENEIFSNEYSLVYSDSISPSLSGNQVHDNTHNDPSAEIK